MRAVQRLVSFVSVGVLVLGNGGAALAATQSVTKTLEVPWSLDDKPPPKEYWSPWAPLPWYTVVRYAVGFRASTGSVNVRAPYKLTFAYDNAQNQGGQNLALKIKVEPTTPTGAKSFDAAFGVALPSRLQVGFIGISGLPSILPWWDAPVDLWGLLALVPEIGSTISSAVSNIGVNMSSTEAMPLGTSKEYHNAREIISVDLKDLVTDAEAGGKPKDMATKLWDKIPGSVKDGIVNGIKLAKFIGDNTQAKAIAIDYLATGLDVIENAGVLSLGADPSWRVAGDKLTVNLRYRVPGRAFSGTVPLFFTASGQEQTVNIPLPMFVSDSDKLEVLVDQLTYEFRLFQTMKAHATFSSALKIELGDTEKVVRWVRAGKSYPEDEANRLQVPLRALTGQIMDFKARGGFGALQVYYASPNMPVKGTVRVFAGAATTPVTQVQEANFGVAHSIFVTGLTKSTDYRIELSYVDTAGVVVQHPQPATTRTSAQSAMGSAWGQTNVGSGDTMMGTPTFTATATSMSATWTTTKPSSTELFISPVSDFSLYIAGIKHVGGGVSSAYCENVPGVKEMVTNHNLTVPGLEPGTTYQVFTRSWHHQDNDPSKAVLDGLAYRTTITTQSVPPPPTTVVRVVDVKGTGVGGVPVSVAKSGSGLRWVFVTGADGRTPQVGLEPGGSYAVQVTGAGCYADASANLSVPGGQVGALAETVVTLVPRPAGGGSVVDATGKPLAATVRRLDNGQTANAGADGRYTFTGAASPSTPVEATLDGYLSQRTTGSIDACGGYSAPALVLDPARATLEVRVANGAGQPLPSAAVLVRDPGQASGGQVGSTDAQGRLIHALTMPDRQARPKIVTATCSPATLYPSQNAVSVQAGQSIKVDVYCTDAASAPASAPSAPPPPPPSDETPSKAKGKGKGKAI
jgi:hypothetical protein